MDFCAVCERNIAEFSYQVEGRRILICEGCLRRVAGDCEWGDYICPITGKAFTSESICIERKEEGNVLERNIKNSKPESKNHTNI